MKYHILHLSKICPLSQGRIKPFSLFLVNQPRAGLWTLSTLLCITLLSLPYSTQAQKRVVLNQIETESDYYIKFQARYENQESMDDCRYTVTYLERVETEKSQGPGFLGAGGTENSVTWETREYEEPGEKKSAVIQGNNFSGFVQNNWHDRTIRLGIGPSTTVQDLGVKYYIANPKGCYIESIRRTLDMMSTADPIPVSNLTAAHVEGTKIVVLNWTNHTHIPEDKYRIVIERTDLSDPDAPVHTMSAAAGETRFRDEVPNLGRPYQYTLHVQHQGGYNNSINMTSVNAESAPTTIRFDVPGIAEDFQVDPGKSSIRFSWYLFTAHHHNRTRLEYQNPENDEWQLIEELSPTVDQYTWTPNFTIIPGRNYNFRLLFMNNLEQLDKLSGTGALDPNGVLSGHVKIINSDIGVPNVNINLHADILQQEPDSAVRYAHSNSDSATPEEEYQNNLNIQNYRFNHLRFYLSIPTAGEYRFIVRPSPYDRNLFNSRDATESELSSQGVKLTIDGKTVINNIGTQGTFRGESTTLIEKQYNRIELTVVLPPYVVNNYTGNERLIEVFYIKPNTNKEIPITSDMLHRIEREVNYLTTTDTEGYFYVDRLYYGEKAEFTITPELNDGERQDIRPGVIHRILSLSDNKQDNILFNDHSSLPVYGKAMAGNCPVQGAEVVFQNQRTGTITQKDGFFEYIIQSPNSSANNELGLFYKHHTFDTTLSLDLSTDVRNRDNPHLFQDITTDSLILSVLSGCGQPLADEVDIELFTVGASGEQCKYLTHTLNTQGLDTIVLPAQKYTARVSDMRITNPAARQHEIQEFNAVKNNIMDAFEELQIDLTERDTTKVVETLNTGDEENYEQVERIVHVAMVKAAFVFRQNIDLRVEESLWNQDPSCTHTVNSQGEEIEEDVYVMEQYEEYPVLFKLWERYDHYRLMKHQCTVDSAGLTINDVISDKRSIMERTITDGNLSYTVRAGEPNINGTWNEARAFQKNLTVTASVENYDRELSMTLWALVTGDKALEPAFITDALHIPEFVLHDPPGDKSYAFLEKGSKISTKIQSNINISLGGNVYLTLNAFHALPSATILFGGKTSFEYENIDNTENQKIFTSVLTDRITTSQSDIAPGETSDVIVGMGLNFVYSKSKKLSFNCSQPPQLESSYTVNQGFATRYALSVYHVKNHILPTLDSLCARVEVLEERTANTETKLSRQDSMLLISKNIYATSRENWQTIIRENKINILMGGAPLEDDEQEIANLTFSGGISIDHQSETSSSSQETGTNGKEMFFKLEMWLKVVLFPSVATVLDVGGEFRYRRVETNSETSLQETVLKQGFHLEDKNVGDFFTVNVSKDTAYHSSGTYMFRTVSGRSSCPSEPFTQTRDRAELSVISNPRLENIPPDQEATYTLRMINNSQSEESRIYTLVQLEGSNNTLRGLISGQLPIRAPGSSLKFALEYGKNHDRIITVEPNPGTRALAMKMALIPQCFIDMYLGEDLLKAINDEIRKKNSLISTTSMYAAWESSCDPITMESPADRWTLNTIEQSTLPVTLSGFNPNSETLSSVEVQYRRAGNYNWETLRFFDKQNLGRYSKKHVNILMDSMPGGQYLLRAKSYCSLVNESNYSNVIQGYVNRNAFVALNTNIEQGWLRSDQLNIQFSKNLAEAYADINIYDMDGTLKRSYPFQKLLLEGTQAYVNIPNEWKYEEVTCRVNLDDGYVISTSGEALSSTSYNFKVDIAPVSWKQPAEVVTIVKNQTHQVHSAIQNKGTSKARIKLVANELSNFITPDFSRTTIHAGGNYPVSFQVARDIPAGDFTGKVTIQVRDNEGNTYYRTMHLTLRVKSISPVWEQPEQNGYRMRLVAQFTPSSTSDTPLSSDEEDKIAAFIDGQLAGTSKIYYDREVQRHIAFLTLNNRASSGTVSFKMWDASSELVYEARETLNYTPDTWVGTYEQPYVLHPAGAEQPISLKAGWNFVSFYVRPDSASIDLFLRDLKIPNAQVKNIQGGFSSWNEATGRWEGTLHYINPSMGYKIYVESDELIRVAGQLIHGSHALAMQRFRPYHYNWLAVHSSRAVPLTEAVNQEALKGGEKVRYGNYFAVLSEDKSLWHGNLGVLEPGKAYEVIPSSQNPRSMALSMKVKYTDTQQSIGNGQSALMTIALSADSSSTQYTSEDTPGIPLSRYTQNYLCDRNQWTEILWKDSSITLADFSGDNLVFILQKASGEGRPSLEVKDMILHIIDQDGNEVERYDYGAFMKHAGWGSSRHWNNRRFWINPADYSDLFEENSPYQLPSEQSGSATNITLENNENYTIPEYQLSHKNAEELSFTKSEVFKKGPYTMTFIVQISIEGEAFDNRYQSLEVMVGNELRARTFIGQHNGFIGAKQHFMIRGNENDRDSSVWFRLIDHRFNKPYELRPNITFVEDDMIGTSSTPYKLNFFEETSEESFRFWPNPVDIGTSVIIRGSSIYRSGQYRIRLFNSAFSLVFQKKLTFLSPPGSFLSYIPTSQLNSGVYYISVTMNGVPIKDAGRLIVN